MTVGSISTSGTPVYLGTVGRTEVTSWEGDDAPPGLKRPPRQKDTYEYIFRDVPVKILHGKRAGQLRLKRVRFRVIKTLGEPRIPYTKRKRVLDDHNYSKTSRVYDSVLVKPAYWYNSTPKGSDWIWFTLGGNQSVQPLLDNNDQNRLISKLWQRVKGSDFNAAIFLGESHQTLALIADTAIRVAKCYFHARKGDGAGALRSLVEGTSRAPLMSRMSSKRSARLYPNLEADINSQAKLLLEIQYGWRPLVNDVIGAAEMLSQELSVPRKTIQRVKVRKVGPKERIVSGKYWDSGFNSFGPGGCTFPVSHIHERKIKAIFTEDDVPSLPARLGLTNLEQTLWELTPFSFLADWFLPIGPALEARAAAQHLTGKFVVTDFLLYREQSGVKFWGNLAQTLGSCPGDFKRFTISRVITHNLVSALPNFKPLNKALSFEHCLNAVGLATVASTMPLGQLKRHISLNELSHGRFFK